MLIEIPLPDDLITALAQQLEERLLTSARRSRWMTVSAASNYLDLSQHSIRALIKRNRIPFYRVEGRILLDAAELDGWIRGGRLSQP